MIPICSAQVAPRPSIQPVSMAGDPVPQAAKPSTPETLDTLKVRIEELEDFVLNLSQTVSELEGKLFDLEDKRYQQYQRDIGDLAALFPAIPSVIDLDPYSVRGYTPVSASNGLLLFVGVESAGPYLAGSKLDRRIGNPSNVSINGFKLWLGEKGGSQRTPFSFATPLQPGAWTHVTVVLPEVAPANLRTMTLNIVSDVISLR
jgi:hypothetical protein